MASPSFETLLPEVQAQIMRCLDSIPDLFSLLRASPRFYQVFRSRREHHMTQLAFNHFHPQISDDVMGLASALRLSRPASRDSVQQYLSKRDRDQLDQKQPSMDLSTTTSLCKVGSKIAWFVDDYQKSSLQLLAKLGSDMELQQDPQILRSTLSITERGRLRRAFCRFETFCCLFGLCKGDTADSQLLGTFDNQARWYLDGFTADEIEEIASIRDYLVRRLWGTFEAIEEDAMHGELSDHIRMLGAKCQPRDWFSFQVKAYHLLHMEFLMSQGLDFLQKILTSDGLKRAESVIVDSTERSHFLTEALEPRFGSMMSLGFDEEELDYEGEYEDGDEEFELDDVDRMTHGLLWAHKNRVPKDWARWPLKGLRDWGYVFWDSSRLRASGVLDQEPEAVAKYKFNEKDRPLSVLERLHAAPERRDQAPTIFKKSEPKPPLNP
ncbi:MAG: hypothetical protein L6R42_006684 [Xanthoria sp. 1 TBL-2021]|nr:MAG: hypothetical protein L6R42_006684 [Xanthoria sp. 1 TBL-2021]